MLIFLRLPTLTKSENWTWSKPVNTLSTKNILLEISKNFLLKLPATLVDEHISILPSVLGISAKSNNLHKNTIRPKSL